MTTKEVSVYKMVQLYNQYQNSAYILEEGSKSDGYVKSLGYIPVAKCQNKNLFVKRELVFNEEDN